MPATLSRPIAGRMSVRDLLAIIALGERPFAGRNVKPPEAIAEVGHGRCRSLSLVGANRIPAAVDEPFQSFCFITRRPDAPVRE